jgi:TP901 family phage tail tape measure protein
MARVKAITSADGEEFSKLSTLAKKLGADTIFSAAQAAQAMGNFAQAGLSVNEILSATGPALDLAATAQIEIAQAADIATKVMRGMGIAVADLPRVIDVMAKAATTANTDIMMLGDAFKFVGPIAKSAGISLEEITAAIQLLSNAGIQGEMAGTTLRGIISTLTSPTKEAAEEMAALGIKIADARGNVRPLVDIVGQLERALAGMGSATRLEKLGRIFPDRQAAAAIELVAQGAAKLADATKKLGNSAGVASRVASTQLDTLRGSIDVVMSSLEGLGIEVGQAVTPAIRKFATVLTDLFNVLSNLAKANPQLIVDFAKMTAGTLAAGVAFVAAGVALGQLAGVVTFLTTPLGLVTAAITAGAVAWLAYTDGGERAINNFLPTIASMKETAVSAFQGIANALKGGDLALAGQIFWAGLKVEWLKGTAYLTRVWLDFKATAVDIYNGIGFEIRKIWAKVTSALTSSWQSAIITMAKEMFRLFDPLSEILARVFGIDLDKAVEAGLKNLGVAESDAQKKARAQALEGQLNDIDAEQRNDQELNRSRAAQDPELARLREELAASQDELNGLLGKASNAAYTPAAYPATNVPMKTVAPEAAANVERGVNAAARKVDVAGTFNARAAAGMGAGESVSSKIEKQIAATERVEKQLEKLNDKARAGKLVFTA